MLKYQLFFFEDLIKKDIRPKAQSKTAPDKAFFSSIISELEIEKEQTLNGFLHTFLSSGKEEALELYVQLHQQNLVTLLNLIAEDLNGQETDDITPAITWNNLYKQIYRTLRDILSFIEEKFTRYLDTNCNVPTYYMNAVSAIFQKDLLYIEERGKQIGCETGLLTVILNFGNLQLAKRAPNTPTYHTVFYLKELLTRVSDLLSTHAHENTVDEKLHELLLYLNFNSLDFFFHYTRTIKREINDLSTFGEKLNHLYLLQKRTNQTPAKPGFICSNMHPGLQEMIKTWIAEEIKYLKEKELFAAGRNLIPEELIRWKDFKVITSLSVPQLGNFLRLLIENEIFLNTNKSELIEFFSCFFTSLKQDNISSGSLRANFYKDDASVSKAVREVLLDLINRSRK